MLVYRFIKFTTLHKDLTNIYDDFTVIYIVFVIYRFFKNETRDFSSTHFYFY